MFNSMEVNDGMFFVWQTPVSRAIDALQTQERATHWLFGSYHQTFTSFVFDMKRQTGSLLGCHECVCGYRSSDRWARSHEDVPHYQQSYSWHIEVNFVDEMDMFCSSSSSSRTVPEGTIVRAGDIIARFELCSNSRFLCCSVVYAISFSLSQ